MYPGQIYHAQNPPQQQQSAYGGQYPPPQAYPGYGMPPPGQAAYPPPGGYGPPPGAYPPPPMQQQPAYGYQQPPPPQNYAGYGAPPFPPQYQQGPPPMQQSGRPGQPPPQYLPPGAGGQHQPPPMQQTMSYQHVPGYDPNFQVSNCSGRRRALLIGINYFKQRGELKGCINDVKNVKQFLQTYFRFRAEDMVILTDDQTDPRFRPTRANITAGMQWLVNDPRPNDSYFFHYSGHGGQVKDLDGDEDDGFDETILPVDYAQAGEIIDDELHARMVRPLPPGVRLTALFDSCHSGSALDLPYTYNSAGEIVSNSAFKQVGGSVMTAAKAYAMGNVGGAISSLFGGMKMLANGNQAQQQTVATRSTTADVIMFSGCKDSQTSADTTIQGLGSTGAMSFAFIAAMTENPHYTYVQLLNRMREILRGKYTQKPQMSTGRVMNMNATFVM